MRAGGQDNGWQIWRYANEFDRGSNPLGSVVTCKFRSQLLTCWNYLEILRLAAGFCLAGSSSSSLTNLSRLLSRSNPFWDFVRIEDFRILLDSDSDRNGNRIENISNFRIRGFFLHNSIEIEILSRFNDGLNVTNTWSFNADRDLSDIHCNTGGQWCLLLLFIAVSI